MDKNIGDDEHSFTHMHTQKTTINTTGYSISLILDGIISSKYRRETHTHTHTHTLSNQHYFRFSALLNFVVR